MAKEYKISSARLKQLEDELHYLKTTREKEVAEHLKEARSFGDLSELNAHRPALLVSILSLHCTGTWPRSVLLALLTPNAMT